MEYITARFRKTIQTMKRKCISSALLFAINAAYCMEYNLKWAISEQNYHSFDTFTQWKKAKNHQPQDLVQKQKSAENKYTLTLAGQNINTWDGIEKLAEYMKDEKDKITEISLGNNYLTEARVDLLTHYFPNVERIDLSNNRISRLTISHLIFGAYSFSLMPRHTRRVIDLRGNNIKEITDASHSNIYPEYHALCIHLSDPLVENNVATELERAIERRKGLTLFTKLWFYQGSVITAEILLRRYLGTPCLDMVHTTSPEETGYARMYPLSFLSFIALWMLCQKGFIKSALTIVNHEPGTLKTIHQREKDTNT